MNTRWVRSALALVLAVGMAVSLLPGTAFAAEPAPYRITVDGVTFWSTDDNVHDEKSTWVYWRGSDGYNALNLFNYHGGAIVSEGYLFIQPMENTVNTITGSEGQPAIDLGKMSMWYLNGSSTTITGGAGAPAIRAKESIRIDSGDWTANGIGSCAVVGGEGSYGVDAPDFKISVPNITVSGDLGVSTGKLRAGTEIAMVKETVGNVVRSARFVEKGSGVTLDGNGGTLNGEATVKTTETVFSLSDYPFEREGYRLLGWRSDLGKVYGYSYKTGEYDVFNRLTAIWQSTGQAKLSTPENLRWGVYEITYILSDGSFGWTERYEVPGVFSWDIGEGLLSQNKYRVKVWRAGNEDKPIYDGTYSGGSSLYYIGNSFDFAGRIEESGDYYFSIHEMGDGVVYTDGDTVTSPVWHYEAPEERLSPITGLTAHMEDEGLVLTWNACEDPLFYRYEVKVDHYHGNSHRSSSSLSMRFKPDRSTETIDMQRILSDGSGDYRISVRAISCDITQKLSSQWVTLDEPYHVSTEHAQLSNIVSSLPEEPTQKQVEEAVEQVKALNSGELARALAADQDGAASVAKLAKLEELAGRKTKVDVGEGLELGDSAQITVVGGALNAAGDSAVTLSLGAAADKDKQGIIRSSVINTQVHNTVAFEMKLKEGDNEITPTEGKTELDVPVSITMPVPENINPQFLVVLHQHSDGSVTEEPISVYESDGKWYVRMVVTSFSVFLMADKTKVEQDESTGTLTVSVPSGEPSFCAVYDAEGRQLATATPVNGSFAISGKLEDAKQVKLFYLKDGKPTRAAETIALQ